MTLKTSLVIAGDSTSAQSALEALDRDLATTTAHTKQLAAANDELGRKTTVSLRQAQAGYTNFGRQIQDVAIMASMPGANIGTIISLQGGQVADAVAQMGGRFSGLASFLAGPYGAALIVGTGLLVNFAQKHFEAGDAAEELKKKELTLTQALDKVRIGTDEARKALEDYNAEQERARNNTDSMIKLNLASAEARLKDAIATREQIKATLEKERASDKSLGNLGIAGGFSSANPSVGAVASRLEGQDAEIKRLGDTARNLRIQDAARDAKAAANPITAINNRYDDMAEAAKRAAAGNDKLSLSLKGTLTQIEKRRSAELEAERASKRSHSNTGRIAEQGEDAAKKVADIKDQFSDLPTQIEKSNKALRELDDIASDVARSKLPKKTKDALAGSIDEARKAIGDSLNKPLEEYLEKSREAVEIDKLLLAGRDDEAAALRVIFSLKDKMGPLDQAQLAAIMQTVAAERLRTLQLRDQRALIQGNIKVVQDMRGALEQTVGDILRGRFSAERILSTAINGYINSTAQRVVEQLFGGTLRRIEAQASGANKIDAATDKMAGSLGKGANAVDDFATTVRGAIARIETAATSPGAAANDNRPSHEEGNNPDDIVVVGKRPKAGQSSGNLIIDMVDGLLRDLGVKIPAGVTGSIKTVLGKLEKELPKALEGAFIGNTGSRIVLGDRGTGGDIGSSIGGALGQKAGEKFLSKGLESIATGLGNFAGPLGALAGGLVGGLIGGIFNKRPSASTGAITSADQKISAVGSTQAAGEVAQIGASVQSSIKEIARQLNAEVGSFSVAIGKYGDYFRVSASGLQNPSAKYFSQHNTNPDSLYDGPDANVALGLAIQNAIGDGAILGISAQVQRALSSSPDIEKALAEALKVQDLETALGGVAGAIQKEFRTFEATAKERLRIASQYGFDIVKVEELNAKQRLELSEKLLNDQVGSLQTLINEMTSGSLFEGSAVDRRSAILAQVDQARADANAGKEGAADKLSQLLQQLNEVSREVFGTTGGFAADRSTILDAARTAIAQANQRISDAQALYPAIQQTNSQLDESNDQLARIAGLMGLSVDYLRSIVANGSIIDQGQLEALARYA